MDDYDPEWRKTNVIMMDNCQKHTSKHTKRVIRKLKLPTLFSAPASFICLPVEGFFAAIKKHKFDLNEIKKEMVAQNASKRAPTIIGALVYAVISSL